VGLLCTSDHLVAEAATIAAYNKHKDDHPYQQPSGFRPHGLDNTSTRIGRKTDITSFNSAARRDDLRRMDMKLDYF
jgi:hypothetical protein